MTQKKSEIFKVVFILRIVIAAPFGSRVGVVLNFFLNFKCSLNYTQY